MNKISMATIGAIAALSSTVVLADPPKEDGLWRGAASASLAVASGNTKSTNFSIGADALKASKEDKLSLFLTSLYGTSTAGNTTTKTANLTRGGLRYDWNLSDRTFVFGLAELEQDKVQRLDSRFVLGGGFGYKLIKEKDLTWDLFGGLTYKADKNSITIVQLTPLPVRTFDSTVSKNTTEALIGEESNHKLSDSTSFKQKLTLYPNLTSSGKYRAQFDAGLVTSIANGINLQVTLSNRYNNDVSAGLKKNDVLFLTGINIAFGAK